jgi:glutathione reductase (NADPH)
VKHDFDLVTLGGGSGGVRASRLAASLGAKVALVERESLGGTCVNVGCVPKKLLSYAAHFRYDAEDAPGFGWRSEVPAFDWPTLIANKDTEIRRLNRVYEHILTDAGVEIVHGSARLEDAHTVDVGGRRLDTDKVLIATGGTAERLDVPGGDFAITSRDAFFLEELPSSVLIVGGGYIALEFASIFRGLGARVCLIHRGELFLRGFDEDVRTVLAEEMQKKGVDIRFGVELSSLARHGSGLRACLTDETVLDVDQTFVAVGRRANSGGLGLEEVGVQLRGKGAIVVDDGFQTTVPNIYAIGDVIDRIQLTPVALAEGSVLAHALFGGASAQPADVAYEDVATAVFTIPPVGTVGLTEHEARRELPSVDVYASRFRPLRHTLSGAEEQSFIKLIVDGETDRVRGFHMVGPDAPEITQGVAIALKCHATKAQFDATIGIHPTSAEELVTMRVKRPAPCAPDDVS